MEPETPRPEAERAELALLHLRDTGDLDLTLLTSSSPQTRHLSAMIRRGEPSRRHITRRIDRNETKDTSTTVVFFVEVMVQFVSNQRVKAAPNADAEAAIFTQSGFARRPP